MRGGANPDEADPKWRPGRVLVREMPSWDLQERIRLYFSPCPISTLEPTCVLTVHVNAHSSISVHSSVDDGNCKEKEASGVDNQHDTSSAKPQFQTPKPCYEDESGFECPRAVSLLWNSHSRSECAFNSCLDVTCPSPRCMGSLAP